MPKQNKGGKEEGKEVVGKGNKGNKGKEVVGKGNKGKKEEVVTQVVKYDELPENHKLKFFIPDDRNTKVGYCDVITTLRALCFYDGTCFEGIPNINRKKDSYPVVQVEVVSKSEKVEVSNKFLIEKDNLYLIAFFNPTTQRWWQFETKLVIDVADLLHISEMYAKSLNPTPLRLGPSKLIQALHALNSEDDPSFDTKVKQALETCWIHLCEATRFKPVMKFVAETLEHTLDGPHPTDTTNGAEAKIKFNSGGEKDDDDDVIYSYIKDKESLDCSSSKEAPCYFGEMFKNFGYLSKFWARFSFTQEPEALKHMSCEIENVKSLRETLAVLGGFNFRDLEEEFEKELKHEQKEELGKKRKDKEKEKEKEKEKRKKIEDLEKIVSDISKLIKEKKVVYSTEPEIR